MTAFIVLAIIAASGAILTLVMTVVNLRLYKAAFPPAGGGRGQGTPSTPPPISICIPARNEADNIEACVRAALASDHPDAEVLIYDDQSDDETPDIIARLAAEDPRVRPVPATPLPPGWNGKQHACARAAAHARGEWLLFTDADVRLEPNALTAALRFAEISNAQLVSTFPRQITRSLAEKLIVPMIFFILFSYLPFARMRAKPGAAPDPSASAGCGQFLFVQADAYRSIGGHAVCYDSMHDGVKLPRALRRAGHRTDLFDGTTVASVRMYAGLCSTWNGFAKNAYEGLGSIQLLVFLTVFHAIAHVAPYVLLVVGLATSSLAVAVWSGLAIAMATVQRLLLCARFRSPAWLAVLHPLSVVLMTAIQWHSYVKHVTGSRSWRGRTGSGAPELVVLVDERDREIGTDEKLRAHQNGGRLHRAFSVFAHDGARRVLLQKRAEGKYHFGGLWSNTCCSHPRPGEDVEAAGRRRLREEMGLDAPVRAVGRFRYEASDGRSGLTERELDHVLVGRVDSGTAPTPDPLEVGAWRWVEADELDRELAAVPASFTPWFAEAWSIARSEVRGASSEREVVGAVGVGGEDAM